MGGGNYNTNTAKARTASNLRSAGSAFAHSANIYSGKTAAKVHEDLDPLSTNKQGIHTGKNIREAMIGDDHPDPTAIAIAFDITASMGTIPRVLQTKLDPIQGVVQRKGYVTDPQILMGAIGDAYCDSGPLQVGQFESDERMNDQLMNIWLVGGGGGQGMETYDLFLYFMARHTYLETFEKDEKKGYLFTMGDERPYEVVDKGHILKHTGDAVEKDIPLKDIVDEVHKRFHWFHFVIRSGYPYEHSMPIWEKYTLKNHTIPLENPETVAETIAMTIALNEGAATLDDAMTDLTDSGLDQSAVQAAGKALATLGANATAMAKTSGTLPGDDSTGVARL